MVELLIRVFEARLLCLIPGDEGQLRHGKVRAEDPVVTLADALGGWPATRSQVHIDVPDVDTFVRRVLAAGATLD
jgi:uncharacterized glyoxalase superfamily protein PhnB